MPPSPPESPEGDGLRGVLGEIGRVTDLLVEPLARNALGCLLADITESRRTVPTRRYLLHERLSGSPSVPAAFC